MGVDDAARLTRVPRAGPGRARRAGRDVSTPVRGTRPHRRLSLDTSQRADRMNPRGEQKSSESVVLRPI
jgi:hypothetical protein